MKALAILLAVIALPVAEIWLVVWLISTVGWGPVLIAGALLFGFGIAMTSRATSAWGRAIERAQGDPGWMNTGFGPAMGDAALLFIGGILMIVPGFITGAVGLLLALPPVRRLVSRLFHGRIESAASKRGYRSVTIIEGETVERPAGYHPADDAGNAGTPRIITGEIVAGPDSQNPDGDRSVPRPGSSGEV